MLDQYRRSADGGATADSQLVDYVQNMERFYVCHTENKQVYDIKNIYIYKYIYKFYLPTYL